MADAKRGKAGMLGSYRLGRRHESTGPEMDDLGRLHEARNEPTGAPAMLLLPGPSASGVPEEDWTLRVKVQASPPYVAVDVEEAPATGEPAALAGLFEVLTRMMERMEWSDETRRHLTRQPEGRLKRWGAGAVGMSVAVLVLLLLVAHWWAYTESQRADQHATAGAVVQAVDESRAPTLVDTGDVGPTAISYPLPAKPFSDQAKAPCKPNLHEVEVNGGCWLELALRPPCGENYAEHQGKCYVPVSARSRKPREPQSIHP
jgi:hypothetical protein